MGKACLGYVSEIVFMLKYHLELLKNLDPDWCTWRDFNYALQRKEYSNQHISSEMKVNVVSRLFGKLRFSNKMMMKNTSSPLAHRHTVVGQRATLEHNVMFEIVSFLWIIFKIGVGICSPVHSIRVYIAVSVKASQHSRLWDPHSAIIKSENYAALWKCSQ